MTWVGPRCVQSGTKRSACSLDAVTRTGDTGELLRSGINPRSGFPEEGTKPQYVFWEINKNLPIHCEAAEATALRFVTSYIQYISVVNGP